MRVVVKYQYYDKNDIIITLPLINMLGSGSDYRDSILMINFYFIKYFLNFYLNQHKIHSEFPQEIYYIDGFLCGWSWQSQRQ